MKIFVFILSIFISLSCFAIEKKELRDLLEDAKAVKLLKEPLKQKTALNIIKKSFKIVRNHKSDIPGNQAPSIESRLRGIYQDVKKKKYQSFNEAVLEGEATFKVYDSAGSLMELLN